MKTGYTGVLIPGEPINIKVGDKMEVSTIPVKKIKVTGKQPRQSFDEEKLQNLAASIQEVGQLQPVIVRREGPDYVLIAGERRLRAIKKNNETEIAAVILDQDLDEALLKQIQLIENIQRQDLDPLERAVAIKRYIDENGLTKKDASKKLGIPRTTLTEWLNILDVAERYRQAVIDDDSPLTLSHITLAKGLASRTGDPTRLNNLLDGVIRHKLSRSETKEVVDIIYKYFHISTEEAISTILLRREHQRVVNQNQQEPKSIKKNHVQSLLTSFTNLGGRLEEAIEKVNSLEKEEKENLIDEFLYIYQMLGLIIPELRNQELDKWVAKNISDAE